jgi:hypothetical protein
MLKHALSKILSARFLFVLAAAVVFVRLGFAIVPFITPELVKDILMILANVITMVVVFYFTRSDRKPEDEKPSQAEQQKLA